MDGIIAINGVTLPFAPIKMTITKSDLYSDSTQRSAETGHLISYLIRQNIYTLELEYLLDTAQTKMLENLINGTYNSTNLSVSFYEDDKEITKNMYPSDRTKEITGTKDSRKYRISFSLIEI
ncbi:MAG: hypothetical protein K2K91_07540 [Ruminococcus sp.]|nr:hypothetical protein [Ruminococcus sp.]